MCDRSALLAKANARIQSMPPPKRRAPDEGKVLQKGQVWSVQADCKDQPRWLVLVREVLDGDMVNIVPVFRWGELAGPEDFYLYAPPLLICSLELEATLTRDVLQKCYGRCEEAAMEEVRQAADSKNHLDFQWGMDYLDEHGPRVKYHLQINDVLESLQVGVLDRIWP